MHSSRRRLQSFRFTLTAFCSNDRKTSNPLKTLTAVLILQTQGSVPDFPTMKIKIKKLEAARRQLQEAIRLWFFGGDIVALLSLAFSAHQIVHDINRRENGRDLLYDSYKIKDEYRKEWINLVKAPYNFFKHADKDPDTNAAVEFDPKIAKFILIFTTVGLEEMGCELNEVECAFNFYFMMTNPHLIYKDKRDPLIDGISNEDLEKWRLLSKEEFFNLYVPLRRKHLESENSNGQFHKNCICCAHNTPMKGPRVCPLCNHVFQGNGWDGIDAHWRAHHEKIMPYEIFWNSLCQAHRRGQ